MRYDSLGYAVPTTEEEVIALVNDLGVLDKAIERLYDKELRETVREMVDQLESSLDSVGRDLLVLALVSAVQSRAEQGAS